jgi:hypothetical protein
MEAPTLFAVKKLTHNKHETVMDYHDVQSFLSSPMMQETGTLLRMWLILSTDVSRLEEPSKKEKPQSSFHRRQYVRAASALIEGFTSMMKQFALLYPEPFSPEEVLLLREKEPLLKENGKASTRERFVPIENNIRFAFTAYAKAHHATFALDCSGSDWQDFKKLINIRNRITHPRGQEELSILDDELDSIKRALDFVSANHSAVQEAIQREMWSRGGMPEPLFEKWMSCQEQMIKAATAGRLEKEWEGLCERLYAEFENYYRQPQ